MSQIAIIGTGAIGGYFGLLAQEFGGTAIESVTFVIRPSLHQAMQNHDGTLVYQPMRTGKPVIIPSERLKVTLDAIDAVRDADVIMIAVKSQHTLEVAQTINGHLKQGAVILSMQNGIANVPLLKEVFSRKHEVLAGIAELNVVTVENRFIHTIGGRVLCERHDALIPLANALRAGGLSVVFMDTAEVEPQVYAKLLLNNTNALQSLSGVNSHVFFRTRLFRHCLASSLEEAYTILLQTRGIKPAKILGKLSIPMYVRALRLPDYIFNRIASRIYHTTTEAMSSTAQDLRKGKSTETDYLVGEFVRLAKSHGLVAPINEKVVELIKEAELRGLPTQPDYDLPAKLNVPKLYPAAMPAIATLAVIGVVSSAYLLSQKSTARFPFTQALSSANRSSR